MYQYDLHNVHFAFQGPLVPVDTDIPILEATQVLEVLLDRYAKRFTSSMKYMKYF